jgi:hypothetical protein
VLRVANATNRTRVTSGGGIGKGLDFAILIVGKECFDSLYEVTNETAG